MEPIFTMQYAEFAVADYLSKKIKGASVFIPASAQEKGIDLLLYRHENRKNTTNTIQVKMSRTYYIKRTNKKLPYLLWFNRFVVQENADWFILVGIYAQLPDDTHVKAKNVSWDTIMLAFKNDEMSKFMDEVKQKKDPMKDDKMFCFSFDDFKNIYQTRGYIEHRDMRKYLIENRLEEINQTFK